VLNRILFFFVFLFHVIFHVVNGPSLPLDSYDDGFHLNLAQSFLKAPADWAPLYIYWMKFLRLFLVDSIHVSIVNALILTSGASLCCLFLVRRLGGSALAQFFASSLTLALIINYQTLHRLNHFNFIFIVLLFFLVEKIFASRVARYGMMSLGLLFLSYIRQDNVIAACVFFAFAVWEFIFLKDKKSLWFELKNRKIPWIAAAVVFLMLSYSPLTGQRMFEPLQRHFGRYFEDKKAAPRSWKMTYQKYFPKAQSFREMWIENPEVVQKYIVGNFKSWFLFIRWGYVGHSPSLVVNSQWQTSGLLSILAWFFIFSLPRYLKKNEFNEDTKKNLTEESLRVFFILFLAVLLKTLVNVGLYGSSVHRYSLELGLILWAVIIAGLDRKMRWVSNPKVLLFFGALTCAVLLLRSYEYKPFSIKYHHIDFFDIKKNIEILKQKTNDELRHRMFAMLSYTSYTGVVSKFNFDCFDHRLKKITSDLSEPGNVFRMFKDREIRLVVIDMLMTTYLKELFGEKNYEEFLRLLPDHGFTQVHKESALTLWIRYNQEL